MARILENGTTRRFAGSRAELARVVESLPIPRERKEVVLLELEDHVYCEMAEAEARGATPKEAEAIAVASLGEVEALAARLVEANRPFRMSRSDAASLGLRLGLSFGAGLLGHFLYVAAIDRLLWMWWSSIERADGSVAANPTWVSASGLLEWTMDVSVVVLPITALVLFRPRRALAWLRARQEPYAFAILLAIASATAWVPVTPVKPLVALMQWAYGWRMASWGPAAGMVRIGIWTWFVALLVMAGITSHLVGRLRGKGPRVA